VWGFATVIESRCTGVAAGRALLRLLPDRRRGRAASRWPSTRSAFIDGAPHRRELHGIYNQYLRCSSDPLYRPEDEGRSRPVPAVFTTSFLIDDFLADNAFFGAREVLVSSRLEQDRLRPRLLPCGASAPPAAACPASA
jgi:hypothetical protein